MIGADRPKGQSAQYQRLFQGLLNDLQKMGFDSGRKASAKNWQSFSTGVRGITYAAAFARGGYVRAEVYIDVGDRAGNKAIFGSLKLQEMALGAAFREPLKWEKLEEKRACRIALYRTGTIEDTAGMLRDHKGWLVERLLSLRSLFGTRLRALAR
jgi:hypothetical protein